MMPWNALASVEPPRPSPGNISGPTRQPTSAGDFIELRGGSSYSNQACCPFRASPCVSVRIIEAWHVSDSSLPACSLAARAAAGQHAVHHLEVVLQTVLAAEGRLEAD